MLNKNKILKKSGLNKTLNTHGVPWHDIYCTERGKGCFYWPLLLTFMFLNVLTRVLPTLYKCSWLYITADNKGNFWEYPLFLYFSFSLGMWVSGCLNGSPATYPQLLLVCLTWCRRSKKKERVSHFSYVIAWDHFRPSVWTEWCQFGCRIFILRK